MRVGRVSQAVWDFAFRMLPHATRPGLREVGSPGPDDPVLLTGNYTATVRRLEHVLAGRDAWLLVANSNGINVWCAATGGHLTDHDVIAVIRSSGIADRVQHRRLVVPQLAATGIEPRRVEHATGWRGRWGPARLEDLPDFLDRGGRVRKVERFMRFPLWERFEMAAIWALPLGVCVGVGLGFALGWVVAAIVAAVALAIVFGVFALIPWIPVNGPRRFVTYTVAALAGTGLGAAALTLVGASGGAELAALAGVCVVAMGILAVDLTGTTPLYAGGINSLGNRFELELVESRCTGAAQCVLVCPRNVLEMDGRRRKVVLARADACVRCGACIVQCPDDALQFRFRDGGVVPASTVRRTRLNLLGRRTIEVENESTNAEPSSRLPRARGPGRRSR